MEITKRVDSIHSWVALDYRKSDGNHPPVCYIESERKKGIKIANDFEGFLRGLKEPVPWEEDEEDFNRVYTKEELVKLID